MVFAHAVNRVTLSGTMFSGAEQWSTGFYFGEEGADAADGSEAMAAAILAAWKTFFQHANSLVNSNYITTQCKVAKIDANGHTVLDKVFYSMASPTFAGATGVSPLPPQCALVVTLLSDRPRGKASKGRMYLPGFSGALGGNGRVQGIHQGQIADNLKTFFDALTGHIDIPNELILAAKGTGPTPALTAQNDYVETIRVGDVVDTQRRRRNGLLESYVSRVLV